MLNSTVYYEKKELFIWYARHKILGNTFNLKILEIANPENLSFSPDPFATYDHNLYFNMFLFNFLYSKAYFQCK